MIEKIECPTKENNAVIALKLNEVIDLLNEKYPEAERLPRLLPCPFCGALPEWRGDDIGTYEVICSNPECLIRPETSFETTKAAAFTAWNRRAKV